MLLELCVLYSTVLRCAVSYLSDLVSEKLNQRNITNHLSAHIAGYAWLFMSFFWLGTDV